MWMKSVTDLFWSLIWNLCCNIRSSRRWIWAEWLCLSVLVARWRARMWALTSCWSVVYAAQRECAMCCWPLCLVNAQSSSNCAHEKYLTQIKQVRTAHLILGAQRRHFVAATVQKVSYEAEENVMFQYSTGWFAQALQLCSYLSLTCLCK